jgi:hypothetical protein
MQNGRLTLDDVMKAIFNERERCADLCEEMAREWEDGDSAAIGSYPPEVLRKAARALRQG